MSWLELGHGGLDWLATGLLHGTSLAVVTWLVCRTVLARSRPALRSALWTLALLKFMVPIGPALAVSLSGALDDLMTAPAAAEATTFVSAEALVQGPATELVMAPGWADIAWAVLFAVYIVAVLAVAGRRVIRHIAARRRVSALPAPGAELAMAVERAGETVGLRRVPTTVIDSGATGPHLVGVFWPVLVIPGWMCDRGPELEAALVHELAHVRRHDTWLRGLQLLVTTVFFFWPVVSLASRRLDVNREMACDDWVIARGSVGNRAYARLLVALAAHAPGRAACASAALIGRRRQLEERVDHLLAKRSSKPALGPVAGAGVVAWSVLALAGSAGANGPTIDVRAECVVDEQLIGQIMASYPDADTDGDGELTRDEICAHNERMTRQLVERAFDELDPERVLPVAMRVDPAADADGDGNLSRLELQGVKHQLASNLDPREFHLDPVAFPGAVCNEAPSSCTEGDGRDIRSE